ncbi:MAG: ketopantoate reductase family protein [Betaproteobacteria bacterium]|nr:ketopantoate reductase family protein [Betaproteobacteria bacterium]
MSANKHILIVGAGAIGGLYAAYLAKVAAVSVIDLNGQHVEAIRTKGLTLAGLTESVTRIEAYDSPAEMGRKKLDAVIILVKSQATEAAFKSVEPYIEGRPVLVTFQNGMGNDELLEKIADLDVAHGVSFEAARYDGPGRVHHLVHGECSWIGPSRGKLESVEWLGALMDQSGLPTQSAADPRGAIWGKFIFNSVMNPIGALVMGVNAARYKVPEVCDLIDAMAAEAMAVAKALGIVIPYDPMTFVKKTRSGELAITKHGGSMAQDIAAGRETEIDGLTGYLVRKANEVGVPVPTCEAIYRIMKGLDYAARANH